MQFDADSESAVRARPGPGAWAALFNPWMLAAVAMLFVAGVHAARDVANFAPFADLKAIWTAGQVWQMGKPELIYPPESPLFTMLPPAEWLTLPDTGIDRPREIYPFLYPPIWAVLMAAFAGPDFDLVARLAMGVNVTLLAGTILLANRAAGSGLNPLAHVVLVLGIFFVTPIALTALGQGQPQILVAFLIVLAIERSRAGAPLVAGAALALAAAIKLYPVIYLAIWIARGNWRAVAAFVAVGGGLALMSVGLAGWDLHRAFLGTLGQISRTVLVTRISLNVDATLAEVFLADSFQPVPSPYPSEAAQGHVVWEIARRPMLWSAISTGLLASLLLAIAVAARRARSDQLYGTIWPFALVVTALFSPIGWPYYMIAAAAFAPTLAARLNPAIGLAILATGTLCFATLESGFLAQIAPAISPGPLFMLVGALTWAGGFFLAWRGSPRPAPS